MADRPPAAGPERAEEPSPAEPAAPHGFAAPGLFEAPAGSPEHGAGARTVAGEDPDVFADSDARDAVGGVLRVRGGIAPAESLPVASVLVETQLPHLARSFDYAVPADADAAAQPGVRVRVRFAGRLTSGFILERRDTTDHVGELAPLERVTSPLPVLTPALLDLCRAIADRYAGTLPDVLRLAIPPRHARAEKRALARPERLLSDPALVQVAGEIGPRADEPPAFADFLAALTSWAAATTGTGVPGDPGVSDDGGMTGEAGTPGMVGTPGVAGTPGSAGAADAGGTSGDAGAPSGVGASDASGMTGEERSGDADVPSAGASAAGAIGRVGTDGPVGAGSADEQAGAPGAGGAVSESDPDGTCAGPRSTARGPRAACAVLPGEDPGTGWIHLGLRAAAPVIAAGLSVLWLVPDHRELAALEERLGDLAPVTVRLSADQGQEERWDAWVTALTGRSRLVIGTRAAAFAPLPNPGLVICFDDADDSYLEQRSPYPHAREVLLTRVQRERSALLLLDYGRSVETQHLVGSGWVGEIEMPREMRRNAAPLVFVPDPDGDPGSAGRLPPRAFELVRDALGRSRRSPVPPGPVLVQVPRAGYMPVIACARCRSVIRCPQCAAKLTAASVLGPFACRACGYRTDAVRCAECSATAVRSVVSGLDKVFEELGRAFSGALVIRSGGDRVIREVEPEPSIVVATTGAEPYVAGGYATALLLDTLWPGPGMRSTEAAIARRLRGASLVRSRAAGGRVLLLDEDPAVQRVVTRFEPIPWAAEQCADRAALGLPPAARTVTLTGGRDAVGEVLEVLRGTAEVRELITEEDPYALVVGFSISDGRAVTTRLAAEIASRSMRGAEIVGVRVDDPDAL